MKRALLPGSDRKPLGSLLTIREHSEMLNLIKSNPSFMHHSSIREATQPRDVTASPYDWGKANRKYKKIFPSRLNTLWYRRYVNKLPEEERIDFQPFDEVQKVDEDIALQFFYGDDGYLEDSRHDRDLQEIRRVALQRYNKVKEQEDKERTAHDEAANRLGMTRYKSVMRAIKDRVSADFGATVAERKVLTPLIDFMHKMTMKKRRQVRQVSLRRNSKWRILSNPIVARKLILMYQNLRKDENQARFRKIINLVVCSMRFIITIRIISGSTKQILKDIEIFSKQQRADSSRRSLQARKKMFDPSRYTFKELQIPFETMLTLSKPWYVRSDKEIDKVLTVLQVYKSFVQYPPAFQRRLARLAWYTEIEANKYIIRERHIACDFYVLLKGKAKEVRLIGDPYIKGKGEMRLTRYIRKSEAFGDESMSHPECQRDYSIISCEPCALLAISVYDYNVMLHTRTDNEPAPEHIIFISHLKLLEDFPKKKLLEEGDENITIHYFRQESVITKNLKTSNYVFVVINGNCRIISEMFPERALPTFRGRKYRRATSAIPPVIVRSSAMEAEQIKQEVSKRIDARIKKGFGALRARKDSVGSILREALTGEIAELQDKSRQILKTLPKEVRKTFNMENFITLVKRSQKPTHFAQPETEIRRPTLALIPPSVVQSVTSCLSLDKWPEILAAEKLKPVISEDDVLREDSKLRVSDADTLTVTEEAESDYSLLTSSWVSTLSQSTLFKDEKGAATQQTPITTPQPTKPADKQSEQMKQTEAAETKDGSKALKNGSVADTKSKAMDQRKKRRIRRSYRDSKCLDSKYYSRWKHIRYMNRGDYAGQEWLDFKTGPYDPPKETWSLVSDGCEVIMIKKSFLLKYLRSDW